MTVKGQISYNGMEKILESTLLCDFYKISHRPAYKKGTQVIYSMLVPRNNKYMKISDKAVTFGVLAFVKKYLIENFNKNFFSRSKESVVKEYKRIIKFTLGDENPETEHLEKLHDLGYLPIKLSSLKEGTQSPMQVPILVIENTVIDFYWVTNYLETLISAELWLPITSATSAKAYRKMLDGFALKSTGSTAGVEFQGHDFSMRGMSSLESAMSSGAAHLLSFVGTDTIPAIMYLEKYYNADVEKELIGTSIPACYDSITEILTENGWKLFKDLTNGEKVAQYHENGNIDFVVPSDYYNMPYKGDMVKFSNKLGTREKTVDLLVTPNHRMVRLRKKDSKLEIIEAGNESYHNRKVYGSKNCLIVSGKSLGKERLLSDLDRLKIAFQADGSFYSDNDKRNGKYSGELAIRFSFKKDRKINRLKNLLDKLNYNYTMYEKNKSGYVTFHIKTTEIFQKDLEWVNLSGKSSEWCLEFLKELSHWDGNNSGLNGIMYSSTELKCVNMVQAISSLAGCKGRISEYVDKRDNSNRKILYYINIVIEKNTISGKVSEKSIIKYDGTVHCVSVPSKMLLVRRNNVVAVSGNTEHSIMSSLTPADGDRDEYEAFKTLITETHPKGFVSVVSDTYDFWRVVTETLPRLKDEIMSRDGRLVIRPDSGFPVDILCGSENVIDLTNDKYVRTLEEVEYYFEDEVREEAASASGKNMTGDDNYIKKFKYEGKYYQARYDVEYNRHDKTYYYVDEVKFRGIEEIEVTAKMKGLIECLWDTFGGTINEQGYKVLDGHIGAIYGDSMTYEVSKAVCEGLLAKGFASTNFVAGIGSYFYNYRTRDSLGMAMKATYSIEDGEEVFLFKDPKTDSSKKSLKGRVFVYENEEGNIVAKDGLNKADEENMAKKYTNLLEPVFENGIILREEKFSDMRSRLNG